MCVECSQTIWIASVLMGIGVGILSAPLAVYGTAHIRHYGVDDLPDDVRKRLLVAAAVVAAFGLGPSALGLNPVYTELTRKLFGAVLVEIVLVGGVTWVMLNRRAEDI